jgi:hypothetical protein
MPLHRSAPLHLFFREPLHRSAPLRKKFAGFWTLMPWRTHGAFCEKSGLISSYSKQIEALLKYWTIPDSLRTCSVLRISRKKLISSLIFDFWKSFYRFRNPDQSQYSVVFSNLALKSALMSIFRPRIYALLMINPLQIIWKHVRKPSFKNRLTFSFESSNSEGENTGNEWFFLAFQIYKIIKIITPHREENTNATKTSNRHVIPMWARSWNLKSRSNFLSWLPMECRVHKPKA